jgi:hypothetical protein
VGVFRYPQKYPQTECVSTHEKSRVWTTSVAFASLFSNFGLYQTRLDIQMAERVGFEPTYQLITGNSISSRARYGRFATSPSSERL